VLDLIWKSCAKGPKLKACHIILINFVVKKITKNTPPKI
jgi:hypothetical protein